MPQPSLTLIHDSLDFPDSIAIKYRAPSHLAKCLRIFKSVESLVLNPAHLFSKPVPPPAAQIHY